MEWNNASGGGRVHAWILGRFGCCRDVLFSCCRACTLQRCVLFLLDLPRGRYHIKFSFWLCHLDHQLSSIKFPLQATKCLWIIAYLCFSHLDPYMCQLFVHSDPHTKLHQTSESSEIHLLAAHYYVSSAMQTSG